MTDQISPDQIFGPPCEFCLEDFCVCLDPTYGLVLDEPTDQEWIDLLRESAKILTEMREENKPDETEPPKPIPIPKQAKPRTKRKSRTTDKPAKPVRRRMRKRKTPEILSTIQE